MSGTYARGITRQVIIAQETNFGVQASGPGQILRRTSFSMDDQPPEIPSSEITEHAQLLDSRLGVPAVPGTLSGQLSPGTYKMPFEGLLRGTWTAGVSIASQANTTLTSGADSTITLGALTANPLTTGFKKGDIVRLSGATGGGVAANGVNLRVTNVTSNSLVFAANTTLAGVVAGWGTQASVTATVTGKKLFTPLQSLQTYYSYSIEDWLPDVSVSHLGRGITFSSIALNFQPNGWASFQASFTGKNMDIASSQKLTNPTDQSTTVGVNGVNGGVFYGDKQLAYITAANLQLSVALQPVPVVGSTDGAAAIFQGMIGARGSISALATSDTFSTDFLNENDVEIGFLLPSSAAAGADFVSFYLGRARLGSDNRQDSDRAIMRTLNFSALQQINGGTGTAWDNTTIVIQDSQA